MTGDRAARRLAATAAARGTAPRLDDFEAAMSEAGKRRRRRGVQSAGVGAALVAVVGVVVGFGAVSGSANARDEVTFVDSPATDDSSYDDSVGPALLGAPVDPADASTGDERTRSRRRSGSSDDAQGPTTAQQPPAAVTRTSRTGALNTCSADWCLGAAQKSAGRAAYIFSATVCLNAGVALRTLDYATSQEVEFEVLAGSHVIWRWSDNQRITSTPHQLSALAAECFTWSTKWTQYDGNGDRVGKANLTLRVRSLASQATSPSAATARFATTAV